MENKKCLLIISIILVVEPIIALLFAIIKYKMEIMFVFGTFAIVEIINIIIFISVLLLKKFPKFFAGLIAIYIIVISFISTYKISFTYIDIVSTGNIDRKVEKENKRFEKNIYGITIKESIFD